MATALSRTGLMLAPSDWRKAAVAVGLSVAAVTAFIVLLDCMLFRTQLPPTYVAFYTSQLFPRLPLICLQAMFEEIEFRLLLMTAFAWIVAFVLKRSPPAAAMIAIIVAAQMANVGAFVLAQPLYGALRYLAVGCVWGWLYWRHGWLAAFVGHASTHLVLDPLLMVGLA